MPKCQFLFIMSVYCRKCPKMKVLGKIWKNHRNSIMQEDPGSQKGNRSSAMGWPHTPPPRRGLAWPAPGHGVGPSGTASRRLFHLYILSDTKTLKQSASVQEMFRSAATIADKIRGIESLCPGTLPGRGIAPEAISIDSTAISITAADSHDEEGVVLPRG